MITIHSNQWGAAITDEFEDDELAVAFDVAEGMIDQNRCYPVGIVTPDAVWIRGHFAHTRAPEMPVGSHEDPHGNFALVALPYDEAVVRLKAMLP